MAGAAAASTAAPLAAAAAAVAGPGPAARRRSHQTAWPAPLTADGALEAASLTVRNLCEARRGDGRVASVGEGVRRPAAAASAPAAATATAPAFGRGVAEAHSQGVHGVPRRAAPPHEACA